MKTEMMTIFVGQCGVQMASAFWELFCVEHAIAPDGIPIKLDGCAGHLKEADLILSRTAMFEETSTSHYSPRAVLLDTEPLVIDEIKQGMYRQLFRPSSFISGYEDAACNYARGFYQLSVSYHEPFANAIRRLAEGCDALTGLCFVHSYGGGTGSGVLTALEDDIAHFFPKQPKIDFGLYPSCQQSSSVVEPYNAVLAMASAYRMDSISLAFDNRALTKIIRDRLFIDNMTFSHMNRLLAQVYSGITANLRFQSWITATLSELYTNLIPFPSLQFLQASIAPIISCESYSKSAITLDVLLSDALRDDSRLIHSDIPLENSCVMALALLYRGDLCIREINSTIEDIKRKKKINFVDWSPCGFKIGGSAMPMVSIKNSGIAQVATHLTTLLNGTSIQGTFAEIGYQYDQLKCKKAFYYWFLYEGMEEQEFEEAAEDFATLTSDYQTYATDDACPEDQSGYVPPKEFFGGKSKVDTTSQGTSRTGGSQGTSRTSGSQGTSRTSGSQGTSRTSGSQGTSRTGGVSAVTKSNNCVPGIVPPRPCGNNSGFLKQMDIHSVNNKPIVPKNIRSLTHKSSSHLLDSTIEEESAFSNAEELEHSSKRSGQSYGPHHHRSGDEGIERKRKRGDIDTSEQNASKYENSRHGSHSGRHHPKKIRSR